MRPSTAPSHRRLALSTVSTSLVGALATPALVQLLLGAAVAVDASAVLRSIVALVPLCCAPPLARGSYSVAAKAAAPDTRGEVAKAAAPDTRGEVARS